MNTICCNNCKISISYNNGISIQSHYLSVSVPCNLRALALKCQNIPQKLQVRNCFSQNKKRFQKKIAVLLSRMVYMIIVAYFYPPILALRPSNWLPNTPKFHDFSYFYRTYLKSKNFFFGFSQ